MTPQNNYARSGYENPKKYSRFKCFSERFPHLKLGNMFANLCQLLLHSGHLSLGIVHLKRKRKENNYKLKQL